MSKGVKNSLHALYLFSYFVGSFILLNHLLTRLAVPDWSIWFVVCVGVVTIYELGGLFRTLWLRRNKGVSEQIETAGGSGA